MRIQSEEAIPNTAPGIKCLEALGTKPLHDGSCGGFTHDLIVPLFQYLGQDGKKLTGMKGIKGI